jgi:AbrB family looped-hinge helix DNA binding protein
MSENPTFGIKGVFTPLVKMQRKDQLTLPSQIRSQLGLTEGDFVDVKIQSSHIVVTPQVVIDRSKFPSVADEYTPEQRRIIDARLDEVDNDATRGQLYGPFDTHKKFIASLH